METKPKVDDADAVLELPSSHWGERATEVRARAGEASALDVRVILEHIASLFEALAKRPH
jgi:hypothetical protein